MLAFLFRMYRLVLSPALQVGFGIRCRYEESCSHYMERALREQGIIKGFMAGSRRLASCNSWSSSNG